MLCQMQFGCGLQRGQDELVATQRAKERFALERRNETLFAGDDSGLRTTEKFIAAEANEIGAGAQCLRWRRFVFSQSKFFRRHYRAASKVLHKRDSFLFCQRSQFSARGR